MHSFLGITSLRSVYEACHDCATKWKAIGLRLGLKLPRLESIASMRYDPEESLQKVLSVWLKKDILPGYPEPSMRVLCDVIASSVGGENPALAERIADKYRQHHLPPGNALNRNDLQSDPKRNRLKSISRKNYFAFSSIFLIIIFLTINFNGSQVNDDTNIITPGANTTGNITLNVVIT